MKIVTSKLSLTIEYIPFRVEGKTTNQILVILFLTMSIVTVIFMFCPSLTKSIFNLQYFYDVSFCLNLVSAWWTLLKAFITEQ